MIWKERTRWKEGRREREEEGRRKGGRKGKRERGREEGSWLRLKGPYLPVCVCPAVSGTQRWA